MKIRILCVGKVKEEFYRRRIREYSEEIQKHHSFEIIEVADEKTEENMSEAERNKRLSLEGERLLKHLSRNAGEYVVAFCIEGKPITSRDWQRMLKVQAEQNEIRQLTFIIGGSLGLDPSVTALANQRWSISNLTFPHQLMRVILTEQIAHSG